MAKTRTTWREKLEKWQEPIVHKFLFAKPQDIEPLLHKVPEGKLVTLKQVKEQLAKNFHTEQACAKAINRSIQLVAEKAAEDQKKAREQATPYWRVIKKDGELNEKLPGGTGVQATHLREEGHVIVAGEGKRSPRVKNFERYLWKLPEIDVGEQQEPEVRKILFPKALDVDALMRKVSKGKLVTDSQIKERLAKDSHADFTCRMVAGIFIRIAAEAAEEDLTRGETEITPYWRVIKADSSLNEKFPGGVEAQAAHLREEGHIIEQGKGKKPPKVKDFEKCQIKL